MIFPELPVLVPKLQNTWPDELAQKKKKTKKANAKDFWGSRLTYKWKNWIR